MSVKPRVLIADAEAPTSVGLRLLLGRSGFDVAAEATDAAAAVAAAREGTIDLALLAADLPGGGIDAVREIHSLLPGVRLVLLTAHQSADELVAAVGAGAAGYLGQDIAAERLAVVLRALIEGEVAYPRRHTGHLVDALRARDARRAAVVARAGERLSDREWDVLQLLAADASTADIAHRLAISQVTVRRHVSSLLRKLRVRDRASAAAWLR